MPQCCLQGYSLNMLSVMESLEQNLTKCKVPRSTCNELLKSLPNGLRRVVCAYSTELLALLSSLPETIIEENISIIVCDLHSVYEDRNQIDFIIKSLKAMKSVTVVLCCTVLKEMPACSICDSADITVTLSETSTKMWI